MNDATRTIKSRIEDAMPDGGPKCPPTENSGWGPFRRKTWRRCFAENFEHTEPSWTTEITVTITQRRWGKPTVIVSAADEYTSTRQDQLAQAAINWIR